MIGNSGGADGWAGFSLGLVAWVGSEVSFCGSWMVFPVLGIGPFDNLDGGIVAAWISSRAIAEIINRMMGIVHPYFVFAFLAFVFLGL